MSDSPSQWRWFKPGQYEQRVDFNPLLQDDAWYIASIDPLTDHTYFVQMVTPYGTLHAVVCLSTNPTPNPSGGEQTEL